MNLDDLHYRLLALQYLGIGIGAEDGHRWLNCGNGGYESEFNLEVELEKAGYVANPKIYPNLIGALDYVDYLLSLVGKKTLLEIGEEIEPRYDLDFEYEKEDWSERVHKV
jgi:hypothetical protein